MKFHGSEYTRTHPFAVLEASFVKATNSALTRPPQPRKSSVRTESKFDLFGDFLRRESRWE